MYGEIFGVSYFIFIPSQYYNEWFLLCRIDKLYGVKVDAYHWNLSGKTGMIFNQ